MAKYDPKEAPVALGFAHYSFCRRHGSLCKLMPAMVAGITGHIWTIEELMSI
jgi:hypothetical protein